MRIPAFLLCSNYLILAHTSPTLFIALLSNIFEIDPGFTGVGNGSGGFQNGNGNPFNSNPDQSLTVEPNLALNINRTDEATRRRHLKSIVRGNSNVMSVITNLKSRLATTNGAVTFEEDGAMLDGPNGNILPPNRRDGHSTLWYNVPQPYYIKVHMHQNQFYNERLELKPSNPVESDQDIYYFMRLFDYTNKITATDIHVSRAGTFALMVNDAEKVKAALRVLNPAYVAWKVDKLDPAALPWKDFMEKYNKAVMDTYEADPQDLLEMTLGLTRFIKNYKINGQDLGISQYEAIYNSSGQITDWTPTF